MNNVSDDPLLGHNQNNNQNRNNNAQNNNIYSQDQQINQHQQLYQQMNQNNMYSHYQNQQLPAMYNQNQYYQNNYQPLGQPLPQQQNNLQYDQQQYYDPLINDQQQQFIGLSNSQLERERRRLNSEKLVRNLFGEMTYTVLFIIMILIVILVNISQDVLPKDDIVKRWLTVIMGYYVGEFILQMLQYHFILKTQRENLLVMATRFLGMVFLVGWLVYGNVIYYQQLDYHNINTGYRWVLFILLLFGYFEMLKCCCVGTLVCIMAPFVIIAIRRGARPNWIPAPPRFVQNLVKDKFNPDRNQAFEQCAICLLDFQKDDEIIPLPCDEKHYFHPECIEQWLKNNNTCPLCKKAITKEALEKQKKEKKSTNNRAR
ncbi:zinc finger protein [Stylonychia lemnae]|uniref:RING-type E3 ubiquitin transferase n=1 Tax=Stylonychia lemnae TaxID=5949 RepID=A0A078AFQ1_STYLE|nr:zinc finger protein [Stylonychia lemnae]|eukprot:CDW81070.1 zinc finger protein [Stylonychia lemnae]